MMTLIFSRRSFIFTNAKFPFHMCEQMKISDMGLRASITSTSNAAQLSLYNGLVQLVTEQSDWTKLFQIQNKPRESYKTMLHYYAFPRLREYPEDIIYQQNGLALHYSVTVRQYFWQISPKPWDEESLSNFVISSFTIIKASRVLYGNAWKMLWTRTCRTL